LHRRAVGGACGVRLLVVEATDWPGEQSGIRTQRQAAQMTGKVVLFLMDEDRGMFRAHHGMSCFI